MNFSGGNRGDDDGVGIQVAVVGDGGSAGGVVMNRFQETVRFAGPRGIERTNRELHSNAAKIDELFTRDRYTSRSYCRTYRDSFQKRIFVRTPITASSFTRWPGEFGLAIPPPGLKTY